MAGEMASTAANMAGKKGKSEAVKAALAGAGTAAGGGLLTGIAQALLTPEEQQERGNAGMPAGSPGAVKGTGGSQIAYNKQNLPTQQSFALEMLRSGGYK